MTTYAVQAMLDLASQPEGQVVSVREIADRQGIKAKYLERIFLKLHRAGIIASKKGPGGGYYINRPVKLIKMGEIMDAVGEFRGLVRCQIADAEDCCSRADRCSIRPYWKRMKDTIDKFLNSSTLYDIMHQKKKP
jgi:Rrf2 family protein